MKRFFMFSTYWLVFHIAMPLINVLCLLFLIYFPSAYMALAGEMIGIGLANDLLGIMFYGMLLLYVLFTLFDWKGIQAVLLKKCNHTDAWERFWLTFTWPLPWSQI